LNPAVKADVLKVESVYQMRHELQDAFFRALFQGMNNIIDMYLSDEKGLL
jgi:ubiquitin-protein ligase E3 A